VTLFSVFSWFYSVTAGKNPASVVRKSHITGFSLYPKLTVLNKQTNKQTHLIIKKNRLATPVIE